MDLLGRATELVEKAFMPWDEAEKLALSEVGINDEQIEELYHENVELAGSELSVLTHSDIPALIRSILVHGQRLLKNTREEKRVHVASYTQDWNDGNQLASEATNAIHPDDIAIDKFAMAMKAKMARQRAKGYSGWDDKEDCPAELLQDRLVKHIAKGDPVDIGNFAMMLFNRGEGTSANALSEQQQEPVALPGDLVIKALLAMDAEARKRGEMYPQTLDEQREDTKSVRKVIASLEFYTSEKQCDNGWPSVKDWPALPATDPKPATPRDMAVYKSISNNYFKDVQSSLEIDKLTLSE